MSHPLDGPRLKVKRAKRHIRWLEQKIRRIKEDPHRVIEKPDAETGGYGYEVVDPDVDPIVGVVVGDAVHNLHTALDHIVWQLAQLNVADRQAALQQGREWPPNTAQFPIFDTPKGFKKDGRDKIACLLRPHRDKIKDLQPYKCSRVPKQEPLWLLYALSITDKHHVLNATVRRLAEIPEAPFRAVGVNPDTGEPMESYPNPESPYTAVGITINPRFNEPGYIAVEAEGDFPVEVAFGYSMSRFGRDIQGQPVLPLLHAATREVEAIISEFEPAFR